MLWVLWKKASSVSQCRFWSLEALCSSVGVLEWELQFVVSVLMDRHFAGLPHVSHKATCFERSRKLPAQCSVSSSLRKLIGCPDVTPSTVAACQALLKVVWHKHRLVRSRSSVPLQQPPEAEPEVMPEGIAPAHLGCETAALCMGRNLNPI